MSTSAPEDMYWGTAQDLTVEELIALPLDQLLAECAASRRDVEVAVRRCREARVPR